ncbi:MAG TPA: hypothetical protein VK168_04115 [Saprospiraceae bacterium]|nr:hypothetical protein [Saprospiraceae bacterium]
MLNKNIVLIGFILSVGFLLVAGLNYPGGSPHDPQSTGFSWTENYLSDMLEYKAVNGADNPARPFAVIGAVLMGISSGLGFLRFSRKLASKQLSVVIKYGGLLLTISSVLVTIPVLHNPLVTIGIVLNLLVSFYITVTLLKSRLRVLSIFTVLVLLSLYGAAFMFTTRSSHDYMPLVQKITHVLQIVWILCLEYFTRKEDFDHIR